MKILFVITRAERGGAQIHLLDVLSYLPSGCQPIVATGETGYLVEEANRLGVPVHVIPSLRQPITPIHDLLAFLKIRKLIKLEKPDLIHAHTSKAGLISRIAGWTTKRPTVFTAHTWSFADGVPSIRQLIALPLEKLAAKVGSKVIAVSRSNAQLATSKAVVDKANLVTIWNGVPDVSLRASPGTRDVPTLIMVARFAPQKDQLSLIRAVAGIKGAWRLLFVGDGPTRATVQREVNSFGLEDRVEFLGDRDDIAGLLAQSDAFVLSTNWEGLPLSILEAMRAGLPVITTNVGGCSEAVTDGVNGFLTEPGDVEHLREKIESLLSSRSLLKLMGAAGRARFDQDFRMESMIEKLLTVYHEVIPREFDKSDKMKLAA